MLEVEITKIRVDSGEVNITKDVVAEEKPLDIYLNKTHLVTIYSSPDNLNELAIGHVLTEGLVNSTEDIADVAFDRDETACCITLRDRASTRKDSRTPRQTHRFVVSGCGSHPLYHEVEQLTSVDIGTVFKARTIVNGVSSLNRLAAVFLRTGGVHAAAIYDVDGVLISLAEDVGRHNAVDKAIGICALKHVAFEKCFLALTGRLTGDLVSKCIRVGVPLVASLGAAISTGIDMARNYGLTLIGFARGNHVSIYSCPERISV